MTEIKKDAIRGPLREEDIRELVDTVLEEEDKFFVPPEYIPDGFSVEWKRMTVLGMRMPEQNTYEMRLARTRWEPVSLTQHPSFRRMVPKGYSGDSVENEGMILMIRPKEITEKVRQIQKYKADSQLQDKMKQVGQAGPGEAPRNVQIMKKSYEALQVPD